MLGGQNTLVDLYKVVAVEIASPVKEDTLRRI